MENICLSWTMQRTALAKMHFLQPRPNAGVVGNGCRPSAAGRPSHSACNPQELTQSSLIRLQTRAALRPLPSSAPAPCTLHQGLHGTCRPSPQQPVENSPAPAAPRLPPGLPPFRLTLLSHGVKSWSGFRVGRQSGLLREEGGRAGRAGRRHCAPPAQERRATGSPGCSSSPLTQPTTPYQSR